MVALRAIVLPRRCPSLSLSLSSRPVPYRTSIKRIAAVRNSCVRVLRSPFSSSVKVDTRITQTEHVQGQPKQNPQQVCEVDAVRKSTSVLREEERDDFPEIPIQDKDGFHMRHFMQHMEEVAPQFEFFLLPHQAKVTCLFRPKGVENEWALLIVRTTDDSLQPRFARLRKPIDILGWNMKTKKLYFFPSGGTSIPPVIYISSAAEYEVGTDSIDGVLRQSWKMQCKRPKRSWLSEELFENRLNKTGMESVNHIWSTLYDPLNLSVKFSFRKASSLLSLNGVPIFQKKLAPKKAGYLYVGTTFATMNRIPAPLAVDTELALFVFGLHEPVSSRQQLCGPLVGVFLFPKQVLSEQGYFCDAKCKIPGKAGIILYMSGFRPKQRSAKRKSLWQSAFYHDLSTELGREEARQILMQYLNDAKQNQCGIHALSQ